MHCTNCRFENVADSAFCQECGHALITTCDECYATSPVTAKFCRKCGTPFAAAPAAAAPAARTRVESSKQKRTEPERRQITVMFCDLAGSTALSEQLDLEDYGGLIHAYQETCAEVIGALGGHIAQYLGDGVLVYFGYPSAHEDDPQRAVRAGLGIVDAVQNSSWSMLRGDRRLQIRVGIHTGSAWVGEIGDGTRPERLALGGVPNVAARLQEIAVPGTVVVSTSTHRMVEGYFACEDLGSHALKGIAKPLGVYRIRGQNEVQSRFELAVRTGLTPLVGREEELRFLCSRWEQVKAGEGQVVSLSGEPGIGKSRVLRALGERLATEPHVRIEMRCSPYHDNSALYPVIDFLEKLLQLRGHASSEEKLERLEQALAPYRFSEPETVALLASLLSLPLPPSRPPLALTPQKQRQRTLEVLLAWLLEQAQRQVLRLAVEDLHWADPSTLEFLGLLIRRVPAARMFVLLTFRPSFSPPWEVRSYLSHVALDRLRGAEVEQMVGGVTGGKALPDSVVQQITSKTDGVPLFVEELTKMVVESHWVRAAQDHYELAEPLPTLAIPATLQDSLMARLDQLESYREVAQVGACLGREFSYELLRAVAPMDETTLQRGLQLLVDAELLHERGDPTQPRYAFKHAMIRDVGYESLLKGRRQQVHQRIAEVLAEGRFEDEGDTQPELVAHHYTAAGLAEEAIPYWQKAGETTGARGAHTEATRHYRAALELLATLPDGPARAQRELGLQLMLALSLAAALGYAAAEVEQTYNRAAELCHELGETADVFPVLRGLCTFYITRNDQLRARTLAEECVRIAQGSPKVEYRIDADTALGYTLGYLGEFEPARVVFERGIELYETHRGSTLTYVTPQDPGVASLIFLADVLWCLGFPDQALQRKQQALSLARALDQPFSLAFVHTHCALFHQLRLDSLEAEQHALAAIEIAGEHGFDLWRSAATLNLGIARAALGAPLDAAAILERELAAWRQIGESTHVYFLAGLAGARHVAGQLDEALVAVGEALEMASRPSAEHMYDVILYWLRGEIRRGISPDALEEAEADFRRAIDIAQQQRARSLELRVTLSLARLLRRRGQTAQARSVLEPVYNWFTEGFETKDLRDARGLLAKLS
jgi:class 3 adenylate cyclase/tetratricopeptide (TPR) repeat protein/ribosomal protein L40E